MRRYFIYLSYDGTNYHGWQVQPNGNSIQAELQRALSLLLGGKVALVGAGRTDAGVHARMMVAHFDTSQVIDCEQLAYKSNRILPRDIAVNEVVRVGSGMHARFSAKSRTYKYYVNTCRAPFIRAYSYELHCALDFDKMNEAAAYLTQVNDFGAFCKSHTDARTTLCDVMEARWVQSSPTTWHFKITANRFLRNMVRALVGTLIDVGRGRMTIEEFKGVIKAGKRAGAGESMPGNALFLENIEY